MAVLTVQTVDRDGLNLTDNDQAAASGGDSFANTGVEFLHVVNGGASTRTLTIATQLTVDGEAVADKTVAVAAGKSFLIGPFRKSTYNDANDRVVVTYDNEADLSVAALKLGSL